MQLGIQFEKPIELLLNSRFFFFFLGFLHPATESTLEKESRNFFFFIRSDLTSFENRSLNLEKPKEDNSSERQWCCDGFTTLHNVHSHLNAD